MADHNDDFDEKSNRAGKTGLIFAGLFYIVSVIMVIINTCGGGNILDPDVKTITIAHWQLEDGFREGFAEAIKQYEKLKLAQGEKVRIIQSTVPFRGYPQWFTTQLISGDPADIIELYGSSQLHNQYFEPMSTYISQPNPYNKGTPLAGISWKDTYVDGMDAAKDSVYAEYFGIGMFFHVLRVYVNKDLLKKATGSDKMPATFDEWMDDCKKLRAYGEKVGQPIIPIGVRGMDKATLNTLYCNYFSQLNGNLNDEPTLFGSNNPGIYELLEKIADKKIDRERLLEPADLIKEIGQYFCEGFTATDLEQTKFLFFTGSMGFFPEGTYNAWSMINNSPFEVKIINIPVIGSNNRYYKNFTGRTSELGIGVGGRFGITKSSKHFELALDFLRFLTSYKINQMTMADYCKWPAAVIKAEYKGILEKFRPLAGDARKAVSPPFCLDKKTKTKMLEVLERIIVNDIDHPKKYFWEQFLENLPYLKEEVNATLAGSERQLFDLEGNRTCAVAGSWQSDISQADRKRYAHRELEILMGEKSKILGIYLADKALKAIEKLEKEKEKEKATETRKEVK